MRAHVKSVGLIGAIVCVVVGCHREPARAPRPAPTRVAVANVTAPSLFASDAGTTPLAVRASVSNERMLGPSFAAVDGSLAALSPDGTLRWASLGAHGDLVARTTRAPCRFDPSRHGTSWPLSPRLALDGEGHACCVHDGDAANPEGAYCADLRANASAWERAHTPRPATGVGSGAGAIALFRDDVWCTSDGGAHVAASFRGDAEQAVTVASCDRSGRALAVAGTRSLAGVHDQTVRAAPPGGALVLVPDAPRGSPFDVRILADGSLAVLIETSTPTLYTRTPEGVSHTMRLGRPPALGLGAWGDHIVLTQSGNALMAFDARTGDARSRTLTLDGPGAVCATRVGAQLVAFGHDGAMNSFAIE